MTDSMMATIAAAAAGPVAATLAGGARDALGALVRVVRNRLGRDPKGNEALAAAQEGDEPRLAALRTELERLVREDPEFAAELTAGWANYQKHLSMGDDGVVNEISGRVEGNVVQARDVQGGISFGR